MNHALKKIFNESAAALHEAFPEKLEKLMLIVTSSDEPVYVSPAVAEHLTKNVDAVKKSIQWARNYMSAYNATGIASRDHDLEGRSIDIISLNETPRAICSSGYTLEMVVIRAFDHEMAHLVAENGYPSSMEQGHLAECTADAFAALRHVQRFGKSTEFFDYYNKAPDIVLGTSPIHYTDPVVQKVRQFLEKTDISGLSLRETAELASKMASEHHLDKKTLEKIKTAFLPAGEAFRRAMAQNNTDIEKCIDVMQQYKDDSDIFGAGKRFLNRQDIRGLMEDAAEMDPWWKGVLDFIDTHVPNPPPAPLTEAPKKAPPAPPPAGRM